MSEDQDLLARIGQLAGHINLHKAQSPSPQTITHEQTSTRSPRPSIVRGYASWRPPRPAPYHVAQGRGRGAHRPYSRNRSLVVKNTTSQSAVPQASQSTADTGTVRSSQSEATYVTTNGRHRQYINASILPKVTEQRKRAIEDSQHRKALTTDRWERQRMHQYLVTLDQQRDSSVTQESPQASSKVHEIMIEGLGFRVLKGGSKLARVYGPSDTSRSTPKRAYVQGVTFVRSKQGNLHRSGVVRASKKCDLPHVDRAGQIRKHAANSADTRSTVEGMETSQANDSDLSSDEDDFADTDGDDIDSDDLNDEFIEGVDGSTQQGVVEQDDFLSI
ncbi:MAG: hypothetical protein Q9186_004092 [Xanthomendoza sp. 1 TL-2023]